MSVFWFFFFFSFFPFFGRIPKIVDSYILQNYAVDGQADQAVPLQAQTMKLPRGLNLAFVQKGPKSSLGFQIMWREHCLISVK